MKTKVHNTDVTVLRSTYRNNNTLAVFLNAVEDGEMYAVITVNIDDSDFLCDDHTAFVDTNNCPWAEQFIKDNKIGEPTGYYGNSGYCMYPLYVFDTEKLPEV